MANYFDLTLDTLGPTGSITRPAQYISTNRAFTISATDASTSAQYMKVWFNTSSTAAKTDSDYPTSWEAYATSKTPSFTASGAYYGHVVFLDSVGNESSVYNSTVCNYSTTKPTVSLSLSDTSSGSTTIYNNDLTSTVTASTTDTYNPLSLPTSLTLTDGTTIRVITLTANDGVSSYPITVTITDGSSNLYSSSFSTASALTAFGITFSTSSGFSVTYDLTTIASSSSVSITSTFKDGTTTGTASISSRNGLTNSTTDTITKDTTLTTPVVTLYKGGTTTKIGTYWNGTSVKVNLSDADTDIVAYKIWDASGTEPAYTTRTSGTALNVDVTLTATTGDGVKTFNAKVKDSAENEKSASASYTLDTAVPTVSISSNVTAFSDVSGHNSATITASASDTVSGATITGVTCNGTTIASFSSPYTMTSATSGVVVGANTLVVTAVDGAGNTNTATTTVIYDNSVDSVSIGALSTWYTAKFNPSVTFSDSYSNITELYVWADTVSGSTTVPSGSTNSISTAAKSGTITVPQANIAWNQGDNVAVAYLHAKAIDAVGNTKTVQATFGYETTGPTIASASFSKSSYSSVDATVIISSPAASVSPITTVRIIGTDITPNPTDDAYSSSSTNYSVVLVLGDGTKNAQVQLIDAAGLSSAVTATFSTELDTTHPTGTIDLQNSSGSSIAGKTYSSDNPRVYLVGYDDKTETGGTGKAVSYELYGNCSKTQGATADTPSTNPITGNLTNGTATLTDIYCTAGAGTKTYYVVFIDDAGNKSEAVHNYFIYTTDQIVATISTAPDYQQISKVHSYRRTSTTEVSTKYDDTVIFGFKALNNINYQAYKVVAYIDAAAAAAGSYADDPIPTTNGSSNTSGSGLNQDTEITVTIRGADYETALGGTGHDGAHYVVMYVQDLAGNWSAHAIIA